MKPIHAAIAAAVLALAPSSASAQAAACTKSPCKVVIVLPAGCGSGITVAPDPLIVKSDGPVEIQWTVMNDQWSLDGDNGIVIHGGDADFTKSAAKDKSISAKTKGPKGKTYKYDV